ncbi:MAG TPA: hypothetical protein VMI94_05445 [Bryobacteraceae bacterium]|nr:hypothetical protein [Bryobacteraceae bacterium]
MAHEPHDVVDAIAVSPNFAQDGTVFAAFGNFTLVWGTYALMKSTDGGTSLSAVAGLPRNTAMNTIAISPDYSHDQTVYVAGAGGLFQSADGGNSWTLPVTTPLASVALSPGFATDNTLFVVTSQSGIRRSTNRGKTWTMIRVPGSLTSALTAIALSPNYPADQTILVGSGKNGIFVSTDAGASWVQATVPPSLPAVKNLVFSPAYTTDRTVFAGTYGAGVLISSDGGASWSASNSGLTDLNVTQLITSPGYTKDSTLYITTAVAGAFISNTRGASWQAGGRVGRMLSPQTSEHYLALAAGAGAGGTMLFIGMWEGMWSSSTGAASWQYIESIPTRLVRSIRFSPNYAADQTIFANTYGSGNLWSTDSGATWRISNTGLAGPYMEPADFSPNYASDGTAFTGNAYGLQKTTNRGATWQLLEGGLGSTTYVRAIGVSPNYAQDSTLLIGTGNGPVTCSSADFMPGMTTHPSPNEGAYTGLFISTDGGQTWQFTSLTKPVSTGCFGISSADFSPAFATDRTTFAASPTTGIYKSTDGGVNWTQLVTPNAKMNIVLVSPNFTQDRTVFAAGTYAGLYKSTDAGSTWSTVAGTANVKFNTITLSPGFAADQTLYGASVQLGLVKFTNGGANMSPVTSFPDNFASAVGLSPNFATDHKMAAAGYHGLYLSADGGASWNYAAEPARIEESRYINGVGQQCPSIVYQGAISYLGNWTLMQPAALASTGAYMSTDEPGDTATLYFLGTAVRWLSLTGPEQGTATVQLDGVSQGTVNLTGSTDQYQQVVWQQHGLSCGLHTLTITATPAAGQMVALDAFDVWLNTCTVPTGKR